MVHKGFMRRWFCYPWFARSFATGFGGLTPCKTGSRAAGAKSTVIAPCLAVRFGDGDTETLQGDRLRLLRGLVLDVRIIEKTFSLGDFMSNISRRSVAKGAAWSIPAVTVAASAPAMAASSTVPPTVKGASYYFDNYIVGRSSTTIDALIQPSQATGGCSYTVSNGPATVSNVSITYWLPAPNYVFTANSSTPWTTLTLDSSKAAKTGPTLGLTYYPYTTTYAGTGTNTTTCGPTYSFSAPAVTTTETNPGGSYYYQLTYSLNGTTKSNPVQSINNP